MHIPAIMCYVIDTYIPAIKSIKYAVDYCIVGFLTGEPATNMRPCLLR
jgi:hypothetical protein